LCYGNGNDGETARSVVYMQNLLLCKEINKISKKGKRWFADLEETGKNKKKYCYKREK